MILDLGGMESSMVASALKVVLAAAKEKGFISLLPIRAMRLHTP